MKRLSTVLLGATMFALGACGGSEEAVVVDNSADTLAVPEDEFLSPTDNTISESPFEPLGNEANAVDTGNIAADSNAAVESNNP